MKQDVQGTFGYKTECHTLHICLQSFFRPIQVHLQPTENKSLDKNQKREKQGHQIKTDVVQFELATSNSVIQKL